MNLNPLSLLEAAINEHGSAVVLRERLALARDQFAALSQKLSDAIVRAEAAELRAETAELRVSQLESDNANLRFENQKLCEQVQALKDVIHHAPHEGLHETCEAILAHLSARDHATVDEISKALGVGKQAVKMHVAELERATLVESSPSYLSTLWSLSDNGRKRMFDKGILK